MQIVAGRANTFFVVILGGWHGHRSRGRPIPSTALRAGSTFLWLGGVFVGAGNSDACRLLSYLPSRNSRIARTTIA